MALNLSVLKSPTGVTLASPVKRFGEEGGTIGRGDGNDWVLSDPDRFLSSRHCSLSFSNGQFYLTDTSTNGTFINGAPEPIGKGGSIPINDGDTIELGDYQFRAELAASVDIPGGDPFTAGNSTPQLEGGPDPFGAPATNDNFGAGGFDSPDAFGGSNGGMQLEDPFADNGFGGSPSSNNDFGNEPGQTSLDPDPQTVDPLAALDNKHGQMAQNDPFAGTSPQDSGLDTGIEPISGNQGLEDIFGTSPAGADAFSNTPQMGDTGMAINDSMEIPQSNNGGGGIIPEGWDDDLLGGNGGNSGANSAQPVADPIPEPRPQRHEVRDEHRSRPLTDPPRQREDLLAERKPDRQPQPQRTSSRTSGQSRRSQTNEVAERIGLSMLNAMGLSGNDLTPTEKANVYATVGELMPVIVNGMMKVLRSRASIKNEFRMNVTTIQPVENNPLKFSANAQEAIENMFLRKTDAYMGPTQAFQEGFDGIAEHQVAIIAGIRAAFKSMMERFNPEKLQTQFDKQSKGVSLPGMQKSKYWNSYEEHYQGFVDNMENTFQYLFGDEFVQAYEDQLRRLSYERKHQQ